MGVYLCGLGIRPRAGCVKAEGSLPRKRLAQLAPSKNCVLMEFPISAAGDDDELAALARRAGSGNVRAFDELARRVRRRIQAWAHAVTHDEDEAEDVAQLVLLRLHARVSEYQGRSRFTTWLYRITRNLATDRRRREAKRSALLLNQVNSLATDQAVRDTPAEAPPHLAELVRFYLEELPGRQREVFELSDVQGLDSTQVGARLGISGSTVRVLLARARRTIRLRILEQRPQWLEEYKE
jgi:RNA polymerase sigma-70 factor (ECF subfamily)